MSHVRRTIVRKLVERYPLDVSPDALITEIYRGSCEPEFARQALSVQIHNLRLLLRQYGWTIPASKPGRGNTSQYRLEPLRIENPVDIAIDTSGTASSSDAQDQPTKGQSDDRSL